MTTTLAPPRAAEVASALRLRRDATVTPGDRLTLALPTGSVTLPPQPPGVTAALLALGRGEHDDVGLAELALEHDGPRSVLALRVLLARLGAAGWLERSVRVDGAAVARLRPLGQRLRLSEPRLRAGTVLALSRFTLLRAEDGVLVAESPRCHARLELADPRLLAGLALLASPAPVAAVRAAVPGLPPAAVDATLALLAGAGLARVADGPDAEHDDPAVAQWQLPDLLLHARSRAGRHTGGYGGTYRLADRVPALPPVREPGGDGVVALPRPDLAACVAADPPLTEVLEGRRSLREHDDDRPVTLDQLGELLYRCARVRSVLPPAPGPDGRTDPAAERYTSRPYPAGGSLYELEVYPVVGRCAGLAGGLYHYDPLAHALETWPTKPGQVTGLLEVARMAAQAPARPQVLLVLTARFGRVMRKYEAVSYALVLKHVGVLYQTFSCVATAMGLASCALGGGDADAFAEVSGLVWEQESSVGELILGSRPPG